MISPKNSGTTSSRCCAAATTVSAMPDSHWLCTQRSARANPNSPLTAMALSSVETNSLTLILQIIMMVMVITDSSSLWFFLIAKLLVKAYCASLLGSRKSFAAEKTQQHNK